MKLSNIKGTIRGHNGILYEVLQKNDTPFKFRLLADYSFDSGIKLRKAVKTGLIELKTTGRVYARAGFLWDGATRFPDIKSVIRSSLGHDLLYTLFVLEMLDQKHRKTVNGKFRDVCIEDGMCKFLATVVYRILRIFGDNHIRSAIKKNNQLRKIRS